jgi:hypothetical protein
VAQRRSDLHYFEGMHALFTRFYTSITNGGPTPVSHSEALRATRVMDAVFASCRDLEMDPDSQERLQQIAPFGVPPGSVQPQEAIA